jgi:hypothetical protein
MAMLSISKDQFIAAKTSRLIKFVLSNETDGRHQKQVIL